MLWSLLESLKIIKRYENMKLKLLVLLLWDAVAQRFSICFFSLDIQIECIPHNYGNLSDFVRGCLLAKFHPGIKVVPGRNHPCLWWNVSYCLHVFAEMKFHPRMNPSLSKRQGWNFIPGWKKEKKTCKHFISGWNFKMSIFFFNVWRMYSNMHSKWTCLNIMKVWI